MRAVLAAVAVTALSVGGSSVGGSAAVEPPDPAGAGVSYAAPVSPVQVVRAFVAPVGEFGAGHRGVDLATAPGAAIRAAGDGVVTFAGTVAGRGVVAVAHADGVSTEYEPVRAAVTVGAVVRRGQVLGRVHGTHGRCVPGACVHWGARRGGEYFDPLLLLRPLGPVRLLPWTGSGSG